MKKFSALLAFCAGNSLIPGEFPYKGQWRGALMFSLICAWTNRWVNNREAGDLRRNQAHYDVSVIASDFQMSCNDFVGVVGYPCCTPNTAIAANILVYS